MIKDQARIWLENKGYRVVLQMGIYPSPSYYIATPKSALGHPLRGSLNGIVKQVKSTKL